MLDSSFHDELALTTQQSAAAKFSLDSAGHLISNGLGAYSTYKSPGTGVAENILFSGGPLGGTIELTCAIAAGSLSCGGNQWGAPGGGANSVWLLTDYPDFEVFTFNVIACT